MSNRTKASASKGHTARWPAGSGRSNEPADRPERIEVMPFPLVAPILEFTEDDQEALDAMDRRQRREAASERILRSRKPEDEKSNRTNNANRANKAKEGGIKTGNRSVKVDIGGDKARLHDPADKPGPSWFHSGDPVRPSSYPFGGRPSFHTKDRQSSTSVAIPKSSSTIRPCLTIERSEESSSLTSLYSSSPPSEARMAKKAKSRTNHTNNCATMLVVAHSALENREPAVSPGDIRSPLLPASEPLRANSQKRHVKNPRRLPKSTSPADGAMQPELGRLSSYKDPPTFPDTDSETIASSRLPLSAGHAFFGILGDIDDDARERTRLADDRLEHALKWV